jgi:lysophospholipase L1-like esterase
LKGKKKLQQKGGLEVMLLSRLGKLILVFGILLVMVSSFALFSNTAKATDVPPSDPNIHYFGRWNQTSSAFNSYWPGAYFKVSFTGTTVQIQLAAAADIYVKIDNGSYSLHHNASGMVNLTPTPLNAGTHTLTVASKDILDVIQFQGLVLDSGATSQSPAVIGNWIEFIGDSITVGYNATDVALSSYAWLTAEQLNAEHTQIAYTGICLLDQTACYTRNSIGMSRQFFKLQTVDFPNSPDWNFKLYQPSAVVINLGTNDATFHVSDQDFQSTYTTFLAGIRAQYPLAPIFVLRTLGGFQVQPTIAAVNSRIAAGDVKLHYIDTTGWLRDYPSPDYLDGVHPSDVGHQTVASRLAPIIKPYLQAQNLGSTIDAPEVKAAKGLELMEAANKLVRSLFGK